MSVLDEFLVFVTNPSSLEKILTQLDFINEKNSMMLDFYLSSSLERCFDFSNKTSSVSANLLIQYLLSSSQPNEV